MLLACAGLMQPADPPWNRHDQTFTAIFSAPALRPSSQSRLLARPHFADCWSTIVSRILGEDGAMTKPALVCVIDDDASLRESLPDLLQELGFGVEAYASAEEFLCSQSVASAQCLVLDVAMPGMSGLDLQDELGRRGLRIPIVFMTAHADEFTRPHILARGGSACLFKPFSDTALLEALRTALGEA